MSIKKKHLHETLKNWIMNESGLGPGIGDVFYLCNSTTGNDYLWLKQMGVDSDHLATSLSTVYADLTSGRNDVLVVMPGSHTVSSAFTWGKDSTHMIGVGAPTRVNTRARFTTGSTCMTPMVTFSADSSIMKNVMWSQEGSNATTAAVNMKMTGERNYLENVTLCNLGALSIAGTAMRNLVMSTGNAENTFYQCTIGCDTVDGTTGTQAMIEFETGAQNARNVWKECLILGLGAALGTFILASGTQCINSFQLFDRCLFFNNDISTMDAMTQAFNIGADCGGFFLLMDCLVYGASAYETTNSGCLFGRHSYAAATTDVAVALTY